MSFLFMHICAVVFARVIILAGNDGIGGGSGVAVIIVTISHRYMWFIKRNGTRQTYIHNAT